MGSRQARQRASNDSSTGSAPQGHHERDGARAGLHRRDAREVGRPERLADAQELRLRPPSELPPLVCRPHRAAFGQRRWPLTSVGASSELLPLVYLARAGALAVRAPVGASSELLPLVCRALAVHAREVPANRSAYECVDREHVDRPARRPRGHRALAARAGLADISVVAGGHGPCNLGGGSPSMRLRPSCLTGSLNTVWR
jgi:hypothetical protein